MRKGVFLNGTVVLIAMMLLPSLLSEQNKQPVSKKPSISKYLSDINRKPLVIGHRGDSEYYPENTIPAFKSAIRRGVDMVELDVFSVKSEQGQKLVVIHDPTVDRTTDGTGIVWNFSLEELNQLDAGGWFDTQFKGVKIPTLEEVFQEVGGSVLVNVEIKYEQGGRIQGCHIEKEVIRLIEKYNLTDSVIISSFNYETLRAVRNLSKDAYIGVLSEESESNLDVVSLCKAIGAISYNPDGRYTTRELVERLHSANILVIPWVYKDENTQTTMTRMLNLGVDGFFANDPKLLHEIVESRMPHRTNSILVRTMQYVVEMSV